MTGSMGTGDTAVGWDVLDKGAVGSLARYQFGIVTGTKAG
jgi:hypothetical protein